MYAKKSCFIREDYSQRYQIDNPIKFLDDDKLFIELECGESEYNEINHDIQKLNPPLAKIYKEIYSKIMFLIRLNLNVGMSRYINREIFIMNRCLEIMKEISDFHIVGDELI